MSDPSYPPTGYPPQPPRRRGLGCFAIGCISVVVLTVLAVLAIGGLTYYLYSVNIRPFLGSTPAPVHAYQADPARYANLTDRYEKFMGAVQAGQAATLTLSADDLNTAVACAPAAEKVRGHLYFEIKGDELTVESSYPIPADDRPGSPIIYYLNGRAYLAASYSAGDFAFLVRKVEMLDGKSTPPFLAEMLANPEANRSINEATNREINKLFHEQLDHDPAAKTIFSRLRTVIVQNGQLVLTSTEGPPLSTAP